MRHEFLDLQAELNTSVRSPKFSPALKFMAVARQKIEELFLVKFNTADIL